MKPLFAALTGILLAVAAAPSAGLGLAIDEATYPGANGDYNNLLIPPVAPPAVVFDLAGGTNTFAGTFGTPGDAGDTILIQLDPLETLTAVRVTFATNATPFNPVAINQGVVPGQPSDFSLDSASSSSSTPLLALNLSGKPDGPVVFSSAPIALGADLYNVTIRTGVLALNDGSRVGYQMAFDVTAIPEPSHVALLLAGLAVLALVLRRRATA